MSLKFNMKIIKIFNKLCFDLSIRSQPFHFEMSLDERIAAAEKRISRLEEREEKEIDPEKKKSLDVKIQDKKEILKLLLQEKGILLHGLFYCFLVLNSMSCFDAWQSMLVAVCL